MSMLLTPDGTVVGCRINGIDYPITLANVVRAVAVHHCLGQYGPVLDSGLTAFEFDRFCDETGLPPHARHTRIIARQLYHWAVQRADAVACAITISRQEAPPPTVDRPAVRAAKRVTAARELPAALDAATESAGRVLAGLECLPQRTFRTLGQDRAQRLVGQASDLARQAVVEAERAQALLRSADSEAMRAGRAAHALRVGEESAAAGACLAAVEEAERRVEAAGAAAAGARRLYGELRGAGEPLAGPSSRRRRRVWG